jgi:hypothetical protein
MESTETPTPLHGVGVGVRNFELFRDYSKNFLNYNFFKDIMESIVISISLFIVF